MAISFTEKIGFLPYEKPILFDNRRIYPIEDYNKIFHLLKSTQIEMDFIILH